MSVQSLQRDLNMLPSPNGQRQPMLDIGSNLHIARSPEGKMQVILDSAEPPNQQISLKRAILTSKVDFDISESTSILNCVVLEFDLGVDAFAVAKMAEHLLRDPLKHLNGDDLIHTLEMFRTLVEASSGGWTFQHLVGLWGELKSLHRLLSMCENNLELTTCVEAWKSSSVHCQDFVFPGGLYAFDSKATTKAQRIHEISSVDQVARREATESCLMSYVIRPVAEHEGISVTQLIETIAAALPEKAKEAFNLKIQKLDIDTVFCDTHHFRERHARPTTLYSVTEIPGVLQFTPLPPGVPTLAWPIVLNEGTCHGAVMNTVLANWVQQTTKVMEDE